MSPVTRGPGIGLLLPNCTGSWGPSGVGVIRGWNHLTTSINQSVHVGMWEAGGAGGGGCRSWTPQEFLT